MDTNLSNNKVNIEFDGVDSKLSLDIMMLLRYPETNKDWR